MIKTLFFLAALALTKATVPQLDALDEESCELLDNGCPADFDIHKLLPHEYSCWRYYSCSNGDKILMRCPRGLVFDPEEETCVSGGLTDRDCINDDRTVTVESEELPVEEIELLPNGCPANYSISQYLPHETYCNMYYQCNFGGKLPMICGPGTHFNPAEQACDHIGVVGCTLPGGNYVPTTTTPSPPTPAPEIDFLPNGCPRNGSIDWLVPHQTNCSLFYACFWGGLIQMECPGNTHFSPTLQRCESPATAGCANNPCSNPGGGAPCPGDSTTTTTTTPQPDVNPPQCPGGGSPPCTTTTTTPQPDVNPPQCPGGGSPPCTTTTTTPQPDVNPPQCPGGGSPPCTTTTTTPQPDVNPPQCPGGGSPPCTTTTTTTQQPDDDPDPPPPGDDPTQCPGGENCPPAGDDCPEDEDPDQKCVEDCNNLPWAHDDCDKYWTCNGNKAVLIVCSEGLHFNPSTNTCDFACNAGCVRENIQATSSNDGLKLYLPWNKIDDNTKELLKLIAY